MQRSPRSPIKGRSLAVFGSFSGVAAAISVSGAGAGSEVTTRMGTSAGGAGGGGGIVPVTVRSWATTVSGTSTILVAVITIPFFKANASTISPFTLNFWPLGILKAWFVLSSSVRTTVFGGVTCQIFAVTLWTVVTVCGVVVTARVCWSFMPGFRS